METNYNQIKNMTKGYGLTKDPKVVAILKECEGRLAINQNKWNSALQAFWESFTSLARCNGKRAHTLLKYVLLA